LSIAPWSRVMLIGERLLDRVTREGVRDATGDGGRVAGGDHNPKPASPREAPSPGVVKYSDGLEGNSVTERLEPLLSFEMQGETFSGSSGMTRLEDAGCAYGIPSVRTIAYDVMSSNAKQSIGTTKRRQSKRNMNTNVHIQEFGGGEERYE